MSQTQRRQFLTATAALLAAPRIARAQAPERIIRVGSIYMSSTPAALAVRTEPLRLMYEQAMRERGYVEGRNLITERRTAEGKIERIPEIVAEFVRLKADVITVGHIGMAQIAAKVTANIPIYSMAGDPLARGLVQSLNRPGGNINGIFAAGTNTVEEKRLQLLRELMPKIRRVAFVSNREWWDGLWGKSLREAATVLGLQAVYIERKAAGFDEAFALARQEKPDAVFFEPSPAAFNLRASIGEFAVASRIPSVCGHQEVVEAGCLMTYNFTVAEAIRTLVDFIDRVAKGAKAGELPYQQFTRYELALNAKTARAIGLTIPQSMLIRADRVIE